MLGSEETKPAGQCPEVHEITEVVRDTHNFHHFGVRRTLYVASKLRPDLKITESDVSRVIKSCRRCQTIDPAPVRWEKGQLQVEATWLRLACDVTHYGGKRYLTMVDCGPSRFAIWREVPNEERTTVCRELGQVFREMGPPKELLIDNGATFRSQQFRKFCDEWGVAIIFRCAYRPQGNGIVERNHRTIKRMAARSGKDPLFMVCWYNATPKERQDEDTAPSAQFFSHRWRVSSLQRGLGAWLEKPIGISLDVSRDLPAMQSHENENGPAHDEAGLLGEEELVGEMQTSEGSAEVPIGTRVFVKPPVVDCTTEWREAVVTGPGGYASIEVDGVPRHVADVRISNRELQRQDENITADLAPLVQDEEKDPPWTPWRSKRQRKKPLWHSHW